MVSALPQRAENQLHVSLMENYPGTLEALGEPIRQVWGCGCSGGPGQVARACGGLVSRLGLADHRLTALLGPDRKSVV